jgi:hypothetical protein
MITEIYSPQNIIVIVMMCVILLGVLCVVSGYDIYGYCVGGGGNSDVLDRRYYNSIVDRNKLYSDKLIEQNHDDIGERIGYHNQMHLLYKDGVPDTYDRQHNKIKGVPPNPRLAIEHLNNSIQLGCVDGYFMLGKVYHYGMHSLQPDMDLAKKYYTIVIENDYPQTIDAIREMTIIYSNEKSDYKKKIMDWLNISEQTTLKDHAVKKTGVHNVIKNKDVVRQNRNENRNEKQVPSSGKVYREIGSQNREDMKSDSQNVHDHTLVKTVNRSVKKLKDTTELTVSVEDTMRLLRKRIETRPDSDKKTDAIKTLDAIERNHSSLLAFNMKETELLHLLWNRIVNNHNDSPDLKDNLYDQLSDSVEHDSVVCSSGRFTRLLDSLTIVDPDVTIKSKEVIHRELMDKSGMIQKRLYNEYSEEDRDEIDSQETSKTSALFSEKLRNAIRDEFRCDYVDSGIMSQSELDSELSVWIQYV